MPNDLDDLMSRMDDINAKPAIDLTALDIDTVIAYHRRNRARKAAGEKAPRPAYAGPDLTNILNRIKAAAPKAPALPRRL